MEKVLFIVPHEDDELFVGGPMLINLARSSNYEVFVFIATNGDSIPYENKARIKESIAVLKNIGVSRDHIIFGGYGDSWDGVHIYNMDEDEVKASHANHTETYFPIKGEGEWHFKKTGKHIPYTKRGYREDLKMLLEDIKADVVVCVDMDVNSDHRCLSLLTEAAMGQVLKENPQYKPVMLKKYSYFGVLFGPDDYFTYPNAATKESPNSCRNPYYLWEDRIRYSVPKDCNTFSFKDNYLFKLASLYKSQEVKFSIGSFANSDVVFWKRNTGNLALNADVKVSSGDKEYLNDFLLLDSQDISVRNCDYSARCWRPDMKDENPSIEISWDAPVKANELILYFNNLEGINKEPLKISLFDKDGKAVKELTSENLKVGMYYEKIAVVSETGIKRIVICLDGVIAEGLGISEIEVLEGKETVPFSEFVFSESDEEKKDYSIENAKLLMDRKKLGTMHRLYNYTNLYRWKRRLYGWCGKVKRNG